MSNVGPFEVLVSGLCCLILPLGSLAAGFLALRYFRDKNKPGPGA